MSKTQFIVRSLVTAAALFVSHGAQAQHCSWRFEQSFSLLSNRNLHAIEAAKGQFDLPARIDAEVELLFGPRQNLCEEGAYSLFLDRFERYATEALRSPRPERDLKLRAAIAAMRKSPEQIDYTGASKEVSQFRQMQSDLGAIAQDAGMTPLMQQLLDVIEAIGAPKATPRPAPSPPDPHVSAVQVPTVPLPAWAVISLYEIEDHARRNENGAIQGKVEAILNWMKTVTPIAAQ